MTIVVQERIEIEGFGPWSIKADVLERMVSVRLHLDPAMKRNGALRVLPGSHWHGRIPEEAIPAMRRRPKSSAPSARTVCC